MSLQPWMLGVLVPPSCHALSLILLQGPSAFEVRGEALISLVWAQVQEQSCRGRLQTIDPVRSE